MTRKLHRLLSLWPFYIFFHPPILYEGPHHCDIRDYKVWKILSCFQLLQKLWNVFFWAILSAAIAHFEAEGQCGAQGPFLCRLFDSSKWKRLCFLKMWHYIWCTAQEICPQCFLDNFYQKIQCNTAWHWHVVMLGWTVLGFLKYLLIIFCFVYGLLWKSYFLKLLSSSFLYLSTSAFAFAHFKRRSSRFCSLVNTLPLCCQVLLYYLLCPCQTLCCFIMQIHNATTPVMYASVVSGGSIVM